MSYYISYDINENIKQMQEHINENNLEYAKSLNDIIKDQIIKKEREEEIKEKLWIDSDYINMEISLKDKDNFKIEIRFDNRDYIYNYENEKLIIENIMNNLPKNWLIDISEKDSYNDIDEWILKVKDTHISFFLRSLSFNMFHKEIDCDEELLWIVYNGRNDVIWDKERVKNYLLKYQPKEIRESVNIGRYIWDNKETKDKFWYLGSCFYEHSYDKEYFIYVPEYKKLKSFIDSVCGKSFQKAYNIINKNIWIK